MSHKLLKESDLHVPGFVSNAVRMLGLISKFEAKKRALQPPGADTNSDEKDG